MAWTRLLRDVTLDDVASVGGKNASLGEMLRELVPLGVRVPDGFAVTADAFRALMRESHVAEFVADQLAGLSPTDIDDLTRRSERIRAAITQAPLPKVVESRRIVSRSKLHFEMSVTIGLGGAGSWMSQLGRLATIRGRGSRGVKVSGMSRLRVVPSRSEGGHPG